MDTTRLKGRPLLKLPYFRNNKHVGNIYTNRRVFRLERSSSEQNKEGLTSSEDEEDAYVYVLGSASQTVGHLRGTGSRPAPLSHFIRAYIRFS